MIKRRIALTLLLVLVVFTIMPTDLSAADKMNGEEVLAKLDKALQNESKYMKEEMTLYTSTGSKRSRSVEVWNKTADEVDKMLVRFIGPANIEGTAFLMVEDDMWLYLPALGKVKRIAGSARQGSFMGSDLSYEDMQALGNTGFQEDYDAELKGETDIEGNKAYQLQLIPVSEEGAYNKLQVWVDQGNYLPLKIEYYNESGEVEKVLTTAGHQEIDGRWTAQKLEMENRIKGSKTVIEIKEVDFSLEIDNQIFTTRYLERG